MGREAGQRKRRRNRGRAGGGGYKQRKAGPSLTSSHRKRGASEGGSPRTRQGHADLSDGELYGVKQSPVNRLN